MWLIDAYDLLLYRQIEDGKEQTIPIEDNKDMEKFIAIDKQEFLKYLLLRFDNEGY